MRWDSYKSLKKKLASRGVNVFDRDLVSVVSCVLNQIEEDVFTRGECLLPGFGRFSLKKHEAHKGWNMQSKTPVYIRESMRFHFKQATRLRDKARALSGWEGVEDVDALVDSIKESFDALEEVTK